MWDASLDIETVERIKATLPDLEPNTCIDLGAASSDVQRYLATYGLDLLLERHQGVCYAFGFVQTPSFRLATHVWHPPGAKATVLVSHGLFDHVGLYTLLIDILLGEGYAVVAFDFPGHGLSAGARAVIADFNDYATVIDECIATVGDAVPSRWLAVGQSTGGAALMNYVLRHSPMVFERMVLLAPLIRPKRWPMVKMSYILLHLFFEFIPRSFSQNSHDAQFCEFLKERDPLQPKQISAVWTGAMKRWVERFDSLPPSDMPCLIVQGNADETVDWESNLPRIQQKFSNHQVQMVEGGMHHLVCEGDAWRHQVFDALRQFLR